MCLLVGEERMKMLRVIFDSLMGLEVEDLSKESLPVCALVLTLKDHPPGTNLIGMLASPASKS